MYLLCRKHIRNCKSFTLVDLRFSKTCSCNGMLLTETKTIVQCVSNIDWQFSQTSASHRSFCEIKDNSNTVKTARMFRLQTNL